MKRFALSLATILFFSPPTIAGEHATPSEVLAMVAKVVKAISANRENTLRTITAKDKQWVSGDLYPVIYDMNGKCLAHGQNSRQVDKNMIELTDADGKKFIRQRVSLAKTKGKFWQDYKFTDPETKTVLQKSAYCEKADDIIVCAGVYKR
jgi:signal transduction histidine kinase